LTPESKPIAFCHYLGYISINQVTNFNTRYELDSFYFDWSAFIDFFVFTNGRNKDREKTQLRVWVGSLLLSESFNDVDEPPVVLDASLGAAGLLLLLLSGLNLWSLATDLTGASERTVNLEVIAIVFTGQTLKIIKTHFLSTKKNEMRNVCPCVATKFKSKQI
jgi:hypothetical protein